MLAVIPQELLKWSFQFFCHCIMGPQFAADDVLHVYILYTTSNPI